VLQELSLTGGLPLEKLYPAGKKLIGGSAQKNCYASGRCAIPAVGGGINFTACPAKNSGPLETNPVLLIFQSPS
jgi:hypothetical protein